MYMQGQEALCILDKQDLAGSLMNTLQALYSSVRRMAANLAEE